jgi:CNT family concentrative nucleoside transporter
MKNSKRGQSEKIGLFSKKFLKVALVIISVGLLCGFISGKPLKSVVSVKENVAQSQQVAQKNQVAQKRSSNPAAQDVEKTVEASKAEAAANAGSAEMTKAQSDSLELAQFKANADSTKLAAQAQQDSVKLSLEKRKAQFAQILQKKHLVFSWKSIGKGILGIALIIFIAWICSTDRKKINWKTVGMALLLQFIVAFSVLMFPAVQVFFEYMGKCFVAVLDWTKAGSNFLFGPLLDQTKIGYIFVFQILPTIIFFSALTSLFFYLGILQKIVWFMGWCLTKLMSISGAESLSCAGNIFLGQTEAPLMVKEYIPRMSRSELMLVMVSGMATMAGGVLAAYIAMLGCGDPVMTVEFAKHLLSASVMAAPGAIAMAKILKPETEPIDNSVEVTKEKLGDNVLDSISRGTTQGLKLAANVAAMLLVFYALIAGVNYILNIISFPAFDRWLTVFSHGRYTDLTLQCILSYLFTPVIWLTGVPTADLGLVGRLLGEKLILTEFIGYQSLTTMLQTSVFTSAKSIIMATYVLCGFANFASIGIIIGGVGGMAPNKQSILGEYGFRALLGATFVALISAAMVGMFLAE